MRVFVLIIFLQFYCIQDKSFRSSLTLANSIDPSLQLFFQYPLNYVLGHSNLRYPR